MVDSKKFKIWDEMASSFHFTSSHSLAHLDKYNKIAKYIISSKAKKVLDLGCGSGILERELIGSGYDGLIDAYDASSAMIKIGKQIINHPKVSFKLIDIDKDFLGDNKYDVIVSINLLFFLKDRQKFFDNVSHRLRDLNSVLLLVTPKPSNQSNNWEFVKEHFRDTNLFDKIFIFINEIINIPRYIDLSIKQRGLFKLEKKGDIIIDNPSNIERMAFISGLEIIEREDIHAKQNWLFVMRRKT